MKSNNLKLNTYIYDIDIVMHFKHASSINTMPIACNSYYGKY